MAARYRWVLAHVSDGLGLADMSRVEDELRVEPNYSRLQVPLPRGAGGGGSPFLQNTVFFLRPDVHPR